MADVRRKNVSKRIQKNRRESGNAKWPREKQDFFKKIFLSRMMNTRLLSSIEYSHRIPKQRNNPRTRHNNGRNETTRIIEKKTLPVKVVHLNVTSFLVSEWDGTRCNRPGPRPLCH